MKKTSIMLAIILWIITAAIFIERFTERRLLTLIPIIAHNQIHGVFGWVLVLSIIFTIIPIMMPRKK